MRRLLAVATVLCTLLMPPPVRAEEAPLAEIVPLLASEVAEAEREARLTEAFRRLAGQDRLTPEAYRRLLEHPSARLYKSVLNRALARGDPALAEDILTAVLKEPPDLPFDAQLELQRGAAYQLAELTRRHQDDELLAMLREPRDLALRLNLARAFIDSRAGEVEALAVALSRGLDQGHFDTEARQSDPLWGQRKLALRQQLNRLLADVGTEASKSELLASLESHADGAPAWLVKEGIELLGEGDYGPAYPLARKLALDPEHELVTRTAALKAMARLYPEEQKQDVALVAQRLLTDSEGEYNAPDVQAVIDRLEEK